MRKDKKEKRRNKGKREIDPSCDQVNKHNTMAKAYPITSLAICLIFFCLNLDRTISVNASEVLINQSEDWFVLGGSVAEYVGEDEFMLDSEINRRALAGTKYISYAALNKNSVPCSQRGASYYNCQTGAQANPYQRGCSAITRCR
ncbi:hypothetical protein Droror1_Dr00024920 [Drosera rotundifolia]